VFLRPVGTPLTVGMSGLAVASVAQSGLDLGWVAHGQGRAVALILISVPLVLQLLACVFSYLARDGATGATLGLLATTWLSLGLVHLAYPAASTTPALGLLLLPAGAMLWLSAAAIALTKPLPAAVFATAGSRFVLAGIYELSSVGVWRDIAGVIGLAIAAVAGYCVLAFELEDQGHRGLLPTFRRGSPEAATDRRALEREAGVRRLS